MSTKVPLALAGAVLTIDLDALASNYCYLRTKSGKAKCGAAIKGDAYGIGMAPAAKVLWRNGCRVFFVARPGEGQELRAILPKATIYVLDGLYRGQARFYCENALQPTLSSIDQVDEWQRYCKAAGRKFPCALHVDTGINRLGLSCDEYHVLTGNPERLQSLNVSLLMSHLACADNPKHYMNRQQLKKFKTLRSAMPNVPASLANSSGLLLGPEYHFDLVRPGVSLYGGNPILSRRNPMQTVAKLEGVVLQIRDVPIGETVGYSATWVAKRQSRIAMIGAGYRDGVPRKLSSSNNKRNAHVWIDGRKCPVVGRVSMDMMAIDVTRCKSIEIGDRAELFGEHIAVDAAAKAAGTISYELLTHLGDRYARIYSQSESKGRLRKSNS